MASFTIGTVDGKTLSSQSINISTSGANAIVTGSAALVGRIYKIWIVTSGANTLKFQDGSTDLDGPVSMLSNGSITLNNDGTPWFQSSPGNSININTTGATQISGMVYFTLG